MKSGIFSTFDPGQPLLEAIGLPQAPVVLVAQIQNLGRLGLYLVARGV